MYTEYQASILFVGNYYTKTTSLSTRAAQALVKRMLI
jgi:hypothetical protein